MNLFTSVKSDGRYTYITGLNQKILARDIQKVFKTSKILHVFEKIFNFGFSKIVIHNFFLPEFIFILNELPARSNYTKVINLIYANTWMSNTEKKVSLSSLNFEKLSNLNYTLKSFQKEFILKYIERKKKYNLNGYILGFEQGLGKTFTSLALMTCLNKEAVIIIAPKSTLRTVWKNEIQNVYGYGKKKIWIIGEVPKESDFYIVNYESIEKLSLILRSLKNRNVGIIVDECHNFKNPKTVRAEKLRHIANTTNCNDILLMSGTPIKALGIEMISILTLIDPYFDDTAKQIFSKSFGLNTNLANQILRNRLGMIMYRKLKSDVLTLPEKRYFDIKIKVPDGDKYTLENVKTKVIKFVSERQDHYLKNKKEYERDFNECLDFLKNKLKKDQEFLRYLKILETVKKHGYILELKDEITWMNIYEKSTLRSSLPNDLKKKFDRSKAVVKYVKLKIMGEVIGGLLNQLRSEMFSKMIEKSPLHKIINEAEKKTILFTTFVDVAKNTYNFLKKDYNPVIVFGETSGSVKAILDGFKTNENTNPLIATIQTLSTGVTLVEANTVVFLNQPWRHTDRLQAEDRVHRIGQDTDVNIFTFILDTGEKANLSTRMEDIVSWSKDMFLEIVGDEEKK